MCVSREMPRLRCGHIPNITRSIPNARERKKRMKMKLEITIEDLKIILQQYYPTISHKTAGRIIRDIEIQSEINQKDEK